MRILFIMGNGTRGDVLDGPLVCSVLIDLLDSYFWTSCSWLWTLMQQRRILFSRDSGTMKIQSFQCSVGSWKIGSSTLWSFF